MIAWWTLNEPAGSTAHDAVGSHDGTHTENPLPVDGIIHGALEFDGHGRFVQLPDDPELNFGDSGSFTLDVWIRPNDPQQAVSILEKRDAEGRGYGLKLVEKRLAFFLGDGSNSSASYLSTETIPLDAWSFVAVTVDRSEDKGIVYINSVPDGTFTPSDTAPGSTDNTEPLLIAAGLEKNFFFGLIDEVEIFGRTLKATEIAFLYTALSGDKCAPCVELVDLPVAWWPLDEIEGSVAADIAGANDGVHLNGPTAALGKVDGALDFDGQSQQVQVTQAVSSGALDFDADQSFTIDAWINPRSFLERTMTIVAKQDPQTGIGYRLFLRSGRLAFVMNAGAASAPAYFSSDPLWTDSSPPGWTCIAVTVKRAIAQRTPSGPFTSMIASLRPFRSVPAVWSTRVISVLGVVREKTSFMAESTRWRSSPEALSKLRLAKSTRPMREVSASPRRERMLGPEPWRLALLSFSSWSA